MEKTLGDVIASLDRSDDSTTEAFRLTKAWINYWVCTDTGVGLAAWFLDGVPIAVTAQPARKSDSIVYWFSSELRQQTLDYYNSLVVPEAPDYNLIGMNDTELVKEYAGRMRWP